MYSKKLTNRFNLLETRVNLLNFMIESLSDSPGALDENSACAVYKMLELELLLLSEEQRFIGTLLSEL